MLEYAYSEPAHLKIWLTGQTMHVGAEVLGLCTVFYLEISDKLKKNILSAVSEIQKDENHAEHISNKILAEKASELRGRFWKNMIRYVRIHLQIRLPALVVGSGLSLIICKVLNSLAMDGYAEWGLCSPLGFNKPLLKVPKLCSQINQMSRSERAIRSLSVSAFSLLESVRLLFSSWWMGANGRGQGLVSASIKHTIYTSFTFVASEALAAFCTSNGWLSILLSWGLRTYLHNEGSYAKHSSLQCAMVETGYDDPTCDKFVNDEIDSMDFCKLVEKHSHNLPNSNEQLLNLMQGLQQQQQQSELATLSIQPHFADLD